jgi:hypothetical protein
MLVHAWQCAVMHELFFRSLIFVVFLLFFDLPYVFYVANHVSRTEPSGRSIFGKKVMYASGSQICNHSMCIV